MRLPGVGGFFAGVCGCIAALLGAVWAWAAFAPMNYFDAEYPMWSAKQALLQSCAVGQTTIAGDSRPMAGLLPQRLGENVVNLALGGGSPIEMAYLADELLRCPAPPQRVIISFAAEHFFETDTYWTRSLPFGFLRVEQAEDVRRVSAQLGDRSIYAISGWYHLEDMVKNYAFALKVPSFYFGAMMGGRFFMRGDRNRQIYEKVLQDRGHHFFGTADGLSVVNASDARIRDFAPGRIFDHYLERFVSRLGAHGIQVFYVGMPLNETTYKALQPGVRAQITAYLESYAARFANFHVVGDPLPFLPDEYFGDAEHLNLRGATKWSDWLASALPGAVAKKTALAGDNGL